MCESNTDMLSIIERIFSNWTALKMAVDNGMGSKERAQDFCMYVNETLAMNEKLDPSDLAAELNDYMDLEFNTCLEDNSDSEVAEEVYRFYNYFKLKDVENLEKALAKLPQTQPWILKTVHVPLTNISKKEDNHEMECIKMDVDSDGWTVITRKKNK